VTTDQPEALKPSSQGQCKARQGKARQGRQGRQAQEISTRLSSTASDPAVSPEAAQRNTAESLTCAWRRETRRDESAVLVAWAPDSQDRILGARCPLSTSL
jgi:hypothetical protein